MWSIRMTERSQGCELRKQVFSSIEAEVKQTALTVIVLTSASCCQKSAVSAGRNCSAVAEEVVDSLDVRHSDEPTPRR